MRLAILLSVLVISPVLRADDEPARTVENKFSQVSTGIDVLEEQHFALLAGKQVGLVTNQTAIDGNGRTTADVFYRAPNIKLIALFSPEHGIRGTLEAGQSVGDTIDPKTHLPVYSLYGANERPTAAMLNAVDVLVFDMQDVGARFYTYLTTMGLCMEAAAKRNISFMVLDRPNPAGGSIIEGEVLDLQYRHFTAYYAVPARHGLTAGEIAQWYNQVGNIHAKLTVIPMSGWRREPQWADTGLFFVPPSPNIRTPTAALLYSGIGMFEATNVSVGRGTDAPFENVGAPWMNGALLAARMNALQLPGVVFSSTTFTPAEDLYRGERCSGVRIEVTDAHAIRPVDIFVDLAFLLRDTAAKDFQPRWEEVARVTGSKDFENLYKGNKSSKDLLALFHKSAAQFAKDRQPYLLY